MDTSDRAERAMLRAQGATVDEAENAFPRIFIAPPKSWRPYGERHPDEDFTARDQARIDAAAAKRSRRARQNRHASRTLPVLDID